MLKHKGTRPIETNRLLLRPFEEGDAPAILRNWASDPEVTRYLSWQAFEEIAAAEALLRRWLEAYSSPMTYRWAITLKDKAGEPIGSIDLVHVDEYLEQGEIGYCLARRFWNKGIMTEALSAVLRELASCGFMRVFARHDTRNPASGRVMEKCGMRLEGVMHRSDKDNTGQFCDMAQYAIWIE